MTEKVKSLYRELIKSAYKSQIPLVVTIELTYRCNERCIHCYVDQEDKIKELNFHEWKGILDRLKEMGTLFLTFTGGEALLHPDFEEIYIYAHKKHFGVRLFTNGLGMNEDVFRILSEYKPLDVQFSIYGHTSELHDRITGVNGSFVNLINAMNRVHSMKIPFLGKCTWLNYNSKHYIEIQRLVESVGGEFLGNITLVQARDCNVKNLDFKTTDEELKTIINHYTIKNDTKDIFSIDSEKSISNMNHNLCGAGVISLRINPQGDVFPCVDMNVKAGNACEKDIKDLWDNSDLFLHLRELKNKDKKECKTCNFSTYCLYFCPAQSYYKTANFISCYPEIKRQAMIRKQCKEQTT